MIELRDNPDLMMELLAVLVRRAGGYVKITADEDPGPFNLASRIGGGVVELRLLEGKNAEHPVQ